MLSKIYGNSSTSGAKSPVKQYKVAPGGEPLSALGESHYLSIDGTASQGQGHIPLLWPTMPGGSTLANPLISKLGTRALMCYF